MKTPLFARTLRGRLLSGTLLITLLSVGLVAMVSYQQARTALEQQALNHLQGVRDTKAGQIEQFFEQRFSLLQDVQHNLRFTTGITAFSRAWEEDRPSAFHAIEAGSRYHHLLQLRDEGLQTFMELFGFYDLFLIDHSGRVVYSVQHEADLFQDLNTPQWRESGLGRAFARSREEAVFEGYSWYPPSGEPAAFFAVPLHDRKGRYLGSAAFQFSMEPLEEILESSDVTGEEMLLGAIVDAESDDLESDGSKEGEERSIHFLLERHRALNQLQLAGALCDRDRDRERYGSPPMELAFREAEGAGFTYDCPASSPVLAAWRYLPEQGWGLVVKQQQSVVLAPIQALNRQYVLVLLLLLPLAWGFSRLFVRLIVRRVDRLAHRARTISIGAHLAEEEEEEEEYDDELSRLQRALRRIEQTDRALIHQAEAISAGEFRERIVPRSPQDSLAHAMNRMAEQLQENIDKLLEQYDFSERIAASIQESLLVVDRQGVIQQVNPAFQQMLGYSANELTGQAVATLFDEAERDPLQEQQLALASGRLERWGREERAAFDRMLAEAPFGIVLVDLATGMMEQPNGEALKFFGATHEQLIGKPLEALLPPSDRAHHATLRHVFTQSPSARLMGQGRHLSASRMDGEAFEVEVGLLPLKIDERDLVVVMLTTVEDPVSWHLVRLTPFGRLFDQDPDSGSILQQKIRHRSGEWIPVQISGGALRSADDTVQGGVLVAQDLRERKRLEQREQFLAYQQGMEEMTASVLHNVGNVLFAISANSERLTRGSGQLQELAQYLQAHTEDQLRSLEKAINSQDGVEQERLLAALKDAFHLGMQSLQQLGEKTLVPEAEQISEAVTHIGEILRIQQKMVKEGDESSHFSPYDLVDEALRLQDRGLEQEQIGVALKLDYLPGEVNEAHNPLLQALINLIKNSREAIHEHRLLDPQWEGGVISIIGGQDAEGWWIELVDDGIGVDAETQKKIFNFGYTTKSKGSGVGLHSVSNFIRSQGGRVTFSSSGTREGARVQVWLPLSDHQ